MKNLFALLILTMPAAFFAQTPLIEPGVSHDLAKWRAEHYSDVRYKLNLTLEKMSPVLEGTIEIRVRLGTQAPSPASPQGGDLTPIILDWRKIRGSEQLSTISNVSINGQAVQSASFSVYERDKSRTLNYYEESNEHLIFRDGVVAGENVIKLNFTSPILTSGSAITRYVDKEDGAEYIYSLFVPSDASTAFPVFDQPDLKARFSLTVTSPNDWQVISNTDGEVSISTERMPKQLRKEHVFRETRPISTYVFAFTAGPWDTFEDVSRDATAQNRASDTKLLDRVSFYNIIVRRSQVEKFKPHAAKVFRLTREGVKYLETYFDYKFPWPKYDLVLIPEFPFGGMEHAGATFLREDRVIFPQEPTKNDYISRATLIFHETAHQWFGDTVTMRWFDDLWLKEGFAEFMAYKTLEKVMPDANAWKVFYERNKQAAYLTDSTRGTTPIYQEIANLNAAKSAYGNIVYRKAPSFLRQAEFYIGPDKFQTAVRAFLKKHEFANAGWEDLVREFERASKKDLKGWATVWVTKRGLPVIRPKWEGLGGINSLSLVLYQKDALSEGGTWPLNIKVMIGENDRRRIEEGYLVEEGASVFSIEPLAKQSGEYFAFPNYQDYGYGIFLLDDKSRDYVLKNIHNEKDDFLRAMMWGSLWDSVREAELDPKDYVELVVKNLGVQSAGFSPYERDKSRTLNGEQDEGTIATLLARVSTAMNYYLSDAQRAELTPKVEAVLIDRMQNAPTLGQRITFYRAFLNIASTENARGVLKRLLSGSEPGTVVTRANAERLKNPVATAPGSDSSIPLKTKDRFDIVTRLAILGDPDAPALLADLEKTETSDDAKRYAYAAKAGFGAKEGKDKYFYDFLNNKQISESWIEAAFGPFNSVRHNELTLPFLEKALAELPNLKRNRKIFFVNGWLGAFIGGQKSQEALDIVNKFLADNPNLDKDLRLKILENVDLIERAVKIRVKYGRN